MKNSSLVASILLAAALTAGTLIVHPANSTSIFVISGRIEAGVEAGCVILRTDNGTEFLLVGGSHYPSPGTEVTVTGYLEYGLASYCMQGQAAIHVLSIISSGTVTTETLSYGTATVSSATVINGSTAEPTSITGEITTISGYIYAVVESPQCYPQCGMPSLMLTYLYVAEGTGCTGSMACLPPPRYYRLLNSDGSMFSLIQPNGTFAAVTGIIVTPSSWSCESLYVPKICLQSDLYVQNINYTAQSRPTSATLGSSTASSLPTTSPSPVPGFEPLTIVIGLVIGLSLIVLRIRASNR